MSHVNSVILQAFAEAVQSTPEAGLFELLPTFPIGDDDLDRQLAQSRVGTIQLGNGNPFEVYDRETTSSRPANTVINRAIPVIVTVQYPVQSIGAAGDFEDDVVGPLETAIANSDLLATISRAWYVYRRRSIPRANIVGVMVAEITWMVNVKTIANNPGVAVG